MANILFIDDDPYTLATYQKAVEIFGHQALIASTATEAIDLMIDEVLDLIILDKNMPDMDGFELLSQIKDRKIVNTTPIVMISADPKELVMDQALQAGATAYVSKPIRLDTLMKLIQDHTVPDNSK
ncbi:MAG: response regulator [candidate division Zixibacteria bacterium]|nr:response regulator [candidate division Zixibacteria bacterium]NIS45936.1 response regulator [candidate division Zixibacteria bacterium]NIU14068.1 response regulator [candidate division Zixibacteria bacterium]NIV06101.1 response regulator [candidate division Zixibacteria bacterium]NIW44885.1 response regulator [Gammaproteobacteria bacterium]